MYTILNLTVPTQCAIRFQVFEFHLLLDFRFIESPPVIQGLLNYLIFQETWLLHLNNDNEGLLKKMKKTQMRVISLKFFGA